mgnify:CR=1 FL=1
MVVQRQLEPNIGGILLLVALYFWNNCVSNGLIMYGIISFSSPSKSSTNIFSWVLVNGHIVDARGTHGFGFDPIFRPISSDKTNAEMSQEEKAGFNPRILAFQKVLEYLV